MWSGRRAPGHHHAELQVPRLFASALLEALHMSQYPVIDTWHLSKLICAVKLPCICNLSTHGICSGTCALEGAAVQESFHGATIDALHADTGFLNVHSVQHRRQHPQLPCPHHAPHFLHIEIMVRRMIFQVHSSKQSPGQPAPV